MQALWCISTLILISLSSRTATTSSIAHEINYEVSNMRNLANAEAVMSARPYHEMIEYEQDETPEDADISPSEIIETHVLPDQPPEATGDATEMKRPRRRRRRRRRKRPKTPTSAPTDALDTYYTLPEEEVRRKPLKYRPPETLPEEVVPENAGGPPRRRVTKRRRRPLKRPIEDYPTTAEDSAVTFNNTDEQAPEYLAEQSVQENHKVKRPDKEDFSTIEKSKPAQKPQPVHDNELTKFVSPEEINELRRRKRPTQKGSTTEEPEVTTVPQTRKPAEEFATTRTRQEDTTKTNINDSKRDLFKFRRLPPTSAILRNVKIRPFARNETTTTTTPKTAPAKEENVISNEIVPQHTENVTKKSLSPVIKSTTKAPKRTAPVHQISEESFEFPIVMHTEQKQIRADPTPPMTASTEHSPVVYIPCNHTTSTEGKNTTNKSQMIVTTTPPVTTTSMENEELTRPPRTEKSTTSRFVETPHIRVSSTHASVTESIDIGESQTQLNYISNKDKFSSRLPPVELYTETNYREPKRIPDVPKHKPSVEVKEEQIPVRKTYPSAFPPYVKPFPGSSKEIIISYTSTSSPNYVFNEIDPDSFFRDNEISLHLRNSSFHRKVYEETASTHRNKGHVERKKLPLAVKSAIIISGAILALAVLGFFALLLSCKIRQAKSRMKCHRELYRDQFRNSEFRQSSRSTSPVVTKATYNGRSFTNSVQSTVPANRNYYLWQTLRKTFQYD